MKIYFHYDLDSHDLLSSLVLNQFIFEKKYELFTNKFPNNFFINNKDKYPAYGEGHTVYYKLEEELQQNIKTLKNNDIEARIYDKYFDLIIYLNPDINRLLSNKNLYFFNKLEKIYGRDEILIIDGHDHQDVNIKLAKKTRYFKRELTEKYKTYCEPISFSFPSYYSQTNKKEVPNILKDNIYNFKKNKKYNILAPNDPRFTNSYIFKEEEKYYEQYSRSLFATTTRKGGWDCLRHYEILRNNCLPFFPNIEKKPKLTMANYPVKLQKKVNSFFEKFILHYDTYFIEYNNLNRQFNHHILNKTGLRKVPSDSYFDKYENLLSEFIDWFDEYGYSSNYSHKLKL